jgi:small subunit ribosomal protein S16
MRDDTTCRRNLPFYRMVVANSRAPRDGKFIEIVGTYNPLPFADGVKEITANSERVRYWLSVGAQPSDRVAWLMGKVGLLPPAPIRQSTKYLTPKSLQEKKK